ncbi:hypothetical protein MPSEU_000001600 [Mayamaea pseudoterrestris]|nr:hypothetical protein MPSEU_000001600 [Mayamaea pseudoterrestris]
MPVEFDYGPIQILAQDGESVSFSVAQTWSNNPVCLLATEYTFSDDGEKICDDKDNVAPGEVGSYKAVCYNGMAEISVYVQDAVFAGAKSVVPGLCELFESGENTISYTIVIPCLPSYVCGELPPVNTCENDSDMIIVKENFETQDSIDSWFYADQMPDKALTAFLVPEDVETSKTFSVPSEASALSVTFDLYELADSENIYLRIQDSYPDLGKFSMTSEDDKSGYFANIRTTVISQGNSMNQVTLVIPSSWFTTGRLTLGFKGSFGIDNLVITAICGYTTAPTDGPTVAPVTIPTVPPTSMPNLTPECITITPSSPLHEFEYGPITIISQDSETVSFSVSQTWSNTPVCLLGTEYTYTDGTKTCNDKSYVAPGEVGLYTALCQNGVADITIFVQDAMFMGESAVMSNLCQLFNSGENTISYAISVPCEVTAACAKLPLPLTCNSDDNLIVAEENFETNVDLTSWFFASAVADKTLTTYIAPKADEMAKTYSVPSGATAMSVSFDLYHLRATEDVYLRIQDSYPDIGHLLSSTPKTVSGYFADIRATFINKEDSSSHITLIIPSSWLTTGRLTLGVKGVIGMDNIVVTSICASSSVGGAPEFLPPSTPASSPNKTPTTSPTFAKIGIDYTYSPPAQETCPCSCSGEETMFTPDKWMYPGIPTKLAPHPSFVDTTNTLETASCHGIGESATHPRIAMPCSNSDTMYYLVQDSQGEYEKLTALKLSGGIWSYVGGSRYVSYDANRVIDTAKVPDIKVSSNGDCVQSFDIQARGNEVCMVFSDSTPSIGGNNIPGKPGTPLVYCLDETDQKWRELGWQNRIGVAGVGDIELLMPSACECSNLMGYYFVMVGKAGTGHLDSVNVSGSAVVWYYNSAHPEAGWRPVGGDSENARIIPGSSSDAHLAISGIGNFACAVHAVVSDDSGLKGFDVFEGDKHLVVARFEPNTKQITKAPTNAPVVTPIAAPSVAPVARSPTSAPVAMAVTEAATTSCVASFSASGSMTSCYPMMAGQHYKAGQVCVEIINGNTDYAKITYDTLDSGYCLKEVQAYIGDNIPSNNKGNPQIGNFPAKANISTSTCTKRYTITTPLLPDCSSGREFASRTYKFAAHSSVQTANGGGGQTAWSTGVDITAGGSWATYSELKIGCKCAATVHRDLKSNSRHLAASEDDAFSTGSWRALDELVYSAAYLGAANSAKSCANDFVFTKSGIPAVGWVDAANGGFAYLSIWRNYPSALKSDSQGFEVAARTTGRAGAIPPTLVNKPVYAAASGMSIDSFEDSVFVAITDGATKKIYVSYIDLSATTVQWHEMETDAADLLPQDQDRSMCSDSLTSQTTATAQNHIKVACNGDIVVGHIIAKSAAPLSLASVAVNGNPLLASATVSSSTVSTMCAGGADQVVSWEDFEGSDTSASWTNGLLSDCDELGHYLGPLTGSGAMMSKTFAVPSMAKSVVLSYDFYNVGALGSTQKLYVYVEGKSIELPYMSVAAKSGTTDGIAWSYTSFGKKYSTQLTIPQTYFANGFLKVQFDLFHSSSIDATKKAGLDKIKLKATCSAGGRRAEEVSAAAAATTSSDQVGEFYCSSTDFPCGDNGKSVYVCHYSARSGYNTYCVPEADSEVLRFYRESYCGACAGFTGAKLQ